jgi:DNA uptake protein ComE-like DNA-binding protein
MVLVITLWLITILAIFGIGLARLAWSGAYFTRWKTSKTLSPYAMNTVMMMTKYRMAKDKTPEYDTLSEFLQKAVYRLGNLRVVYSVADEERKININKAPGSVLKELPDMNTDKASSIVTSTLRPFKAKEEILLLDEIDEDDYMKIKDLITVYGEGPININTCSEETLEVLGMEGGLVSRIMEYREGEDGETGTEDDGIFDSRTGILNTFKERSYLSLRESQALMSLINRNLLGVKSRQYRIVADVYAQNRLIDKYSIVLGAGGGDRKKIQVLEWRRH